MQPVLKWLPLLVSEATYQTSAQYYIWSFLPGTNARFSTDARHFKATCSCASRTVLRFSMTFMFLSHNSRCLIDVRSLSANFQDYSVRLGEQIYTSTCLILEAFLFWRILVQYLYAFFFCKMLYSCVSREFDRCFR